MVFVAVQSALVMPFVVAQMVLKVRLIDHPAVIAVINPLACGLTLLVGYLIGRPPLRAALPVGRVPVALLGGAVLTLAGAVILLSEADNLFRTLLPMPEWVLKILQSTFASERSPVGSLVVLVLVAPLTEEPLCRGLMLHGFLSRYSPRKAVLLSALLFAGLHMNPWQFISAFALGGLLGWWFLRTGSLVPCIFGHAFYNGCVFAAPYLPFEIPGFNQGGPLVPTGFQPWWLNLIGVALTLTGLVLFRKMTSGMKPCLPKLPVRVPPLLAALPPMIADGPAVPTGTEPAPPVIGAP